LQLMRASGVHWARRALDERFALTKKLQKDAVREGRAALAESWASRGREFEHEATVIANAIERLDRIASDARAK